MKIRQEKGAIFLYNILLVDDEPGHLAGLSKILRRLRPEYAVRTAKNGEEALNICDSENFEIIITDIQMPIMDGLDFYERLPSSRKPQKVIFLSGYDYFEYAQKAIGLGSFEYVLKPVDIDKFTHILEKAERSLEEELAGIEEKERLSAKLQTIIPLYHNRILSDWNHGLPLSKDEERELCDTLLFQGGGSIIVTAIHGKDHPEDTALELSKERIREKMQELLSENGVSVSFFSEQERSLLISATNARLEESLLARIEEQFRLAEFESVRINVGISRCTEQLVEAAPSLFKEAYFAGMEGFYSDGRIVFASTGTKIDPRLFLKSSARLETMLGDAIHATHGEKAIENAARTIIAKLVEGERLPAPSELIAYCKKLLMKLSEAAEYLKPEIREGLAASIAESLDEVHAIEQLQAVIAGRLADIAAAITEARRDSKETVIFKCLAYMEEHYMEDLSLESVSAVFHFNSSYFCHYFKSKLNINFSQYLTQIRLTKAKELLELSNDKIYQVAGRLGYQDAKYFNRVFKKEFGLTPEEYRSIARSMKQG